MKKSILIALIVLIPLVIGSVPLVRATDLQPPSVTPTEISVAHSPDEGVPPELLNPDLGFVDTAFNGLFWMPEKEGKFSKIKHRASYGGTRLRVNTPGDYWVDLPLSFDTYIDGIARKISFVEFCGQTTNYNKVFPIYWLFWDEAYNFDGVNIIWASNNNVNCSSRTFSPAVWKQSLAISVLVRFKNTSDYFTFRKAWLKTIQ